MNKKINFTKAILNSLKIPLKGFDTYSDEKEKGLKLYITSNGVKTFFVRKFVNRKDERIIIGQYPTITIEKAREKALKIKSQISDGINPNEEKRTLRQDMTLDQFFDLYIENYSKKYKRENSIRSEKSLYKTHITKPLGKRKLISIVKYDIEKLQNKIINQGAKYSANRTIALLRGMYNRAIEWGHPAQNPAIHIKMLKEESRDTFLHSEDLSKFLVALDNEPNQELADFLKVCLFTGARKSNVMSMRWGDLQRDLNRWVIPETKSGKNDALTISDFVFDILDNIQKRQDDEGRSSQWVFPSEISKSGHLEEPKGVWRRILKSAGLEDKNLRIHDLRRTLGSWQTIEGASLKIVQASLLQKSSKSTEGYARLIQDPVKKSIEKATQKMLSFKEGLK